MIDFTKEEATRILEKFDYDYLGFRDAGWGKKFYTFYSYKQRSNVIYTLGEMRRRAWLLAMQDWHRMRQASEALV